MAEKLCVFCTHFSLSTGTADTFTEYSGYMECSKEYFDFPGGMFGEGSEDSLRNNIYRAKTCKDYKQVEVK